jgi:hypothetical protein
MPTASCFIGFSAFLRFVLRFLFQLLLLFISAHFVTCPGCFVTHAFPLKNGIRSDVGTLPGCFQQCGLGLMQRLDRWPLAKCSNQPVHTRLAGGSVRLAAERPQPYYITDLGTLGGKLRSGKTWLHSLTGSEKFEPGMPDLRSRGSQGHGGRFSNSQPNSDKLLRAIVLA